MDSSNNNSGINNSRSSMDNSNNNSRNSMDNSNNNSRNSMDTSNNNKSSINNSINDSNSGISNSINNNNSGINNSNNNNSAINSINSRRSMDNSINSSSDSVGGIAPPRWPCSAIEIRDGCKSYGRGSAKVTVLDHLDMTVPEGSIYGLLGPSGCGKTTLLGCIVNNLRLDRGRITIYGYPPGTAEAAVPGHRVGYMPQELALFQEFTIAETLQYFGRIHSMGGQRTRDRTDFLVDFLDLPRSKRKVSQLSGGQQRRVSFAVALLHEPEILILDEPTVGVDPLLRTSIWEHLGRVSQDTHSTIIITTHYIEEARQATRVGLMRQGRLLAEAAPHSLTRHFAITSLEDVFLKLCLKDGDLQGHKGGTDNEGYSSESGIPMEEGKGIHKDPSLAAAADAGLVVRKSPVNDKLMLQEREEVKHSQKAWTVTSKNETYFSSGRFKALLGKNFIKLSRNVGFLLLSFLLPPLQTILFCVTVGGTPKDLRVAVTNLDTVSFLPDTMPLISDLYLDQLPTDIVKQEVFDTFDEGYDSVATGRSWGLLYFNENFTKALLNPEDFDPSEGKMEVYMDNTNQQISYTILIQLYASLQRLLNDAMNLTPLNLTISIPVVVEEPVYGSANPTFTEFMAPGVILTLTYFMAMALTAISFIIEKKEGLYDRSRVAGVNNVEVMFAHIVTQMGVMLIQIALILVFMFAVFLIPCEGSMLWVILLAVLQGLCGMTFGWLISVSVEDEMTAMQASMGIFYPILLLSGIVWPVQGMPRALRYISYILPQTYACESIRAILYKGWDITHSEVYIGYLITTFWMCFHVVLAALVLKIKSK